MASHAVWHSVLAQCEFASDSRLCGASMPSNRPRIDLSTIGRSAAASAAFALLRRWPSRESVRRRAKAKVMPITNDDAGFHHDAERLLADFNDVRRRK
jgi:hypothetical protein